MAGDFIDMKSAINLCSFFFLLVVKEDWTIFVSREIWVDNSGVGNEPREDEL